MHLEILSKEQTELLPILSQFKREYYLIPNPPTETEVQEFLTEISISGLDIL